MDTCCEIEVVEVRLGETDVVFETCHDALKVGEGVGGGVMVGVMDAE